MTITERNSNALQIATQVYNEFEINENRLMNDKELQRLLNRIAEKFDMHPMEVQYLWSTRSCR